MRYHDGLMPTRNLHSFTRRHLAWLLWLALLLPLAQTVAAWHLMSHTASGQSGDNTGPKALGQDRCDLCMSAAAVLGGAPRLSACPLVLACGLTQAPFLAPPQRHVTAATPAYNSRAPPAFQP